MAEALATESNNWIYNQIKDNRNELGALAAVSMHNPAQAVKELTRAVKTLGSHSVMVNNWQHAVSANGGEKFLLYDAGIQRFLVSGLIIMTCLLL